MVANLQKAGVEVMPYINTRMWDTSTKSFIDERAVADVVRFMHRIIPTRDYDGHVFATMCPAAPKWQDKIASICDELVNAYGVGGIYLNQLSAPSLDELCLSRHEHLPGGGNYWARGHWQMLDKIKKRMPDKNRFFTSEHFAESYINQVDGFLVWMCFAENTIPFAQAVYGGRTVFWGRSFGSYWEENNKLMEDRTGEGFYSKLADILINNIQLGWIYAWIMEEGYEKKRAFVRDLAHLYDAALKDASLDGQFIKPPKVTGLGNHLKVVWVQRRNVNMEVPPVAVAAWNISDGGFKILAINVSRRYRNSIWNSPAGNHRHRHCRSKQRRHRMAAPGRWGLPPILSACPSNRTRRLFCH